MTKQESDRKYYLNHKTALLLKMKQYEEEHKAQLTRTPQEEQGAPGEEEDVCC